MKTVTFGSFQLTPPQAKLARRIAREATARSLVGNCVLVATLEAKHGSSPESRRMARRLARELEAKSTSLANLIAA